MLQGLVETATDNELRCRVWQNGREMYYPAGDEDLHPAAFHPLPAENLP
jgi:general stress protein 26